jgi:NAD(P)-dependent dehydrogenase (short-subunit alcohol dehydrogenase family)
VGLGKLMGLVNCAGIGPAEKTVGKNGPHSLALFTKTITVNLIGSFNMIRLAADAMCRNEPEATGERGVLISTASWRPTTARSARPPTAPARAASSA